MANRYWVGGTGTWNATNTTNWSSSSGGSGGASVPTSADDVFFNVSSSGTSYTVTVNTTVPCNNFNFARPGSTGYATLSGTGRVNVFGNATGSNSQIILDVDIYFVATTTGKTVLFLGAESIKSVTFDGVGGGWTLSYGIVPLSATAVALVNGSLNLASYNINASTFDTSNSNTRTLNFGTSGTITVSGSGATAFNCATSTGLTVSGTLTGTRINMTSASAKTFAGGGKTWPGISNQGGGALTITGANTFAGPVSSSLPAAYLFQAGVTQTFTSSLSFAGGATNGITIASTVAGTQATLSQASGLSFIAGYITIQDMVGTGGQTWNAVNSTNNGNNTNWTFTTGTDRYWVGGSGTWDGTTTTNWGAVSGGGGGSSAPIATTDVIFDAASGTTYTATLASGATCKNLSITRPSGTFTFAGASVQFPIYGSINVLSTAGIVFTGVNWDLTGTATTNVINLNGIALNGTAVTFDGDNGAAKWTLSNNITLSTGSINLYNGILDLSTYTATAVNFNPGSLPSYSFTRQLIFGTGSKVIVSGSLLDCQYPLGLAITGTSNIEFSSASAKTFKGGSITWGSYSNTGAGALTITGSNTFSATCQMLVAPSSLILTAGTTQTYNGNFVVTGTAGNLINIQSSVAGTRATLTKSSGTVSVNYANIKDTNATGGVDWYAYNSTDSGNNTGWQFPAPSRGSMMIFC